MVDVDSSVYYNAAKTCGTLASGISDAVKKCLLPGLIRVSDYSKGMGGNHPAAAGWNKAYLQHAQESP